MCPKFGVRQSGFSLVTAIFILVILAALGAAMVTFSGAQQATVAMDIQSARANQAARAGIEWGAYQALRVPGFTCAGTPFTLSFTGTNLAGFATQVSCAASSHSEGGNTVTLFDFTANASYGAANTPDYVAREVSARIARCTDAGGASC
jgi:MSHA biogenesis protein MshP